MAKDGTTRHASETQENRIVKKLGGRRTSNSGAGHFDKSDIVIKEANMSLECKTCLVPKESITIKKDWLEKHKKEAWSNRLGNAVLAFNFDYNDTKDYYIIDDSLMRFLVEKLLEENN